MPKYLLLKHYRGGPEPHRPFPPMDQWAPEDVEAHMAFLKHVGELLEENGEYVDAQALTPARPWGRHRGRAGAAAGAGAWRRPAPPAGARGPGPAGRGLRCRRGRAAGGAAGGAAGVARA